MLAIDPEISRIVALRAIRGNLLRLRWHAAALRFELALRRHDCTLKYGYDPAQPRRPKRTDGAGEWVRLAGGASRGGRGRFGGGDFPGATYGQLVRLDLTITRSQDLLRQVRRYDPEWQPTGQNWEALSSIEGTIRRLEARADEAQARLDQLRSGIGGNFGPPLTTPASEPTSREFDARAWIDAYRSINNSPDLFGRPVWSADRGTVAVTEVDGRLYFGTNSGAPTYTTADRKDANYWRTELDEKYSAAEQRNRGLMPNDSFYHAEVTALLRVARDNSGTLEGRSLEIHVDRGLCDSCYKVLPKLGLELGNPTITYVDIATGERMIMRNGRWTQ